MTNTTALTLHDIERAYDDARWLGWGYLGERDGGSPAVTAAADSAVIAEANRRGWDYERLFAWLNSRPGRHFADEGLHTSIERAMKHAIWEWSE